MTFSVSSAIIASILVLFFPLLLLLLCVSFITMCTYFSCNFKLKFFIEYLTTSKKMILLLLFRWLQLSGENSFVWFGPKPALSITDPEMIREIMSKMDAFPKPSDDPLKLLSKGIASFEAEKWTKHRKLISPAFHVDKLKVKRTRI